MFRTHQPAGGDEKADHGEYCGDVIAAVEGLHRIFLVVDLDGQHSDRGGDDTEGARDEREQQDPDEGEVLRRKEVGVGFVQPGRQDHGADVLGRRRFEQIGAAPRAVADIVAHQVGNHRRIARIVFRDPCFDLSDEVRTDVGCLRVDSAAELRKERHEARAEPVPHDEERDLGDVCGHPRQLDEREEAGDAEQAHGDDEETRDRAAAKSGLQSAVHVLQGAGGRADIRADRDPHPHVSSGNGARRPEHE